jgi:uncharacterized protein YjbJ (UPF0337 family)
MQRGISFALQKHHVSSLKFVPALEAGGLGSTSLRALPRHQVGYATFDQSRGDGTFARTAHRDLARPPGLKIWDSSKREADESHPRKSERNRSSRPCAGLGAPAAHALDSEWNALAAPCVLSETPHIEELLMVDRDRVEGSLEQGKGKVKEVVGKVTGDKKTEGEGKADQVKGKIQNTIGGIKDTLKGE